MQQELRYERKFYIENVPLPDIIGRIKTNIAGFVEIYHERQINNIYFDTPGFESYYDNLYGSNKRLKARIRWYGETFGENKDPVLELKIKRGLLGYKESFKLPNFSVDEDLTKQKLQSIILSSVKSDAVRNYVKSLSPVLLNVYTRKYYISSDKSVRLTIDSNMHYFKVNNMGNRFVAAVTDHYGVVIELKYAKESEPYVAEISNSLPFIMTKNSKYLQGLSRIGLVENY